MLAVNPNIVDDPAELKSMVMDVNNQSDVLREEDYLSDSVYKYNAKTHSLSMCDSNGLFHDKAIGQDTMKQNISKGRGRI